VAGMNTGFAVIYRFRIAPHAEDAFIDAWSRLTELIRDHRGGRGSRLHRGDDGIFYAYAQWPDRPSWQSEGTLPPEADELRRIIANATVERFDPIPLTLMKDCLLPEA
jgi:hypothetical protein